MPRVRAWEDKSGGSCNSGVHAPARPSNRGLTCGWVPDAGDPVVRGVTSAVDSRCGVALHREPRKLSSIVPDVGWTGARRLLTCRETCLPSHLTLERIASDRRIVSMLVRARLRDASTERTKVFFDRAADDERTRRREGTLNALLPRRRQWPRPSPKRRRALAQQGLDARAEALINWIMRRWGTPRGSADPWLNSLRCFAARIRRNLCSWEPGQVLDPPRVFATVKERGTSPGKPDYFRCLATFKLEASVMISLVAKYFVTLTDHLLGDEVLAFRQAQGGEPADHHTAVSRVLTFRDRVRPTIDRPLWAAEADIRGFFDCVLHDVAMNEVGNLLQEAGLATVDPHALSFLDSYLAAYAFNVDGHRQAEAFAKAKLARPGHRAEVKWPAEELTKLGVPTTSTRIGIPQGGALSAFLANAVLRAADRAVLSTLPKSSSLYLRYCDDILILAPRRRDAAGALKAYISALEILKLPSHPPRAFGRPYSTRRRLPSGASAPGTAKWFWQGKSKNAYAWNRSGTRGHVPWIAFVGYQIRYDGVLRIRRSSIEKEERKQREITHSALSKIRKVGQRRTRRSIATRLRDRLRAMAVGTGVLHRFKRSNGFCFLHGFRLAGPSSALESQLRELDRYRGRQLARAYKAVHTFAGPRRPPRAASLKFTGRPYSYAGAAKTRKHK